MWGATAVCHVTAGDSSSSSCSAGGGGGAWEVPAGARLAERLRGVWGQGDEETIRRENKYLHKISWKFLLGIRNNGRTQLLEKGAANRRQDGPAAIPVLLAPRQATVPEIGLQTAREDAAKEPQGHRRREYRPPQSSRRCIERITRAPGGPGRQSPERLAALLSSALDGFLTAQRFLPKPALLEPLHFQASRA